MTVHLLATLPWTRVRDLASPHTVAVLPIGAIEAHGPHLPLATDVIIAEAMAREGARRLSARGFDVLVLPAIPFTAAPFASGFAGTIDVSGQAVVALVTAAAASLARHGIALTVLANAHLDPAHVAALRDAEAHAAAGGRRLIFPDVTRRRWAARLTDEFQGGACHAGRYETSVVLSERPELVHTDVMARLPANHRSLVQAKKDGRMSFEEAGGGEAYFGAPAEATAEEGRQIVAALGAILESAVVEAFDGAKGDRR